jgi:hypothetical protein
MSKMTLLVAAAAGYVLGARAGRQRYDQIAATARKLADDPRVQRVAHRAQDAAAQQASAAAELAKDKVTTAASSAADLAKDKVRGDSSPNSTTQTGMQATP